MYRAVLYCTALYCTMATLYYTMNYYVITWTNVLWYDDREIQSVLMISKLIISAWGAQTFPRVPPLRCLLQMFMGTPAIEHMSCRAHLLKHVCTTLLQVCWGSKHHAGIMFMKTMCFSCLQTFQAFIDQLMFWRRTLFKNHTQTRVPELWVTPHGDEWQKDGSACKGAGSLSLWSSARR